MRGLVSWTQCPCCCPAERFCRAAMNRMDWILVGAGHVNLRGGYGGEGYHQNPIHWEVRIAALSSPSKILTKDEVSQRYAGEPSAPSVGAL